MNEQHPKTTEEKLDIIIGHLESMDKRDKLRTWGGFVRGIIGLIPTIILIWSVWYFYAHGTELIKQMTAEAAKQAAGYSQTQSDSFMQQIQKYLPR
jgi:hypothetical protein